MKKQVDLVSGKILELEEFTRTWDEFKGFVDGIFKYYEGK